MVTKELLNSPDITHFPLAYFSFYCGTAVRCWETGHMGFRACKRLGVSSSSLFSSNVPTSWRFGIVHLKFQSLEGVFFALGRCNALLWLFRCSAWLPRLLHLQSWVHDDKVIHLPNKIRTVVHHHDLCPQLVTVSFNEDESFLMRATHNFTAIKNDREAFRNTQVQILHAFVKLIYHALSKISQSEGDRCAKL